VSVADQLRAKGGAWFPELSRSPAITDLFNRSAARDCASALLGKTVPYTHGGQIALRFPGTLCTSKTSFTPLPWWSRAWHIDGFHSKDNGIKLGDIKNFTVLVGTYLSNTPGEFCGTEMELTAQTTSLSLCDL
jgi:hypothetical protein